MEIKEPDLYAITRLLNDPTRIAILEVLMDGRFHTVNELARYCKVKGNTASFHMTKLLAIGWVETHKQGRFRYYRLADEQLAGLLEQLLVIAPAKKQTTLVKSMEMERLQNGRTCYNHLAGKLGVKLLAYFTEQEILSHQREILSVTEKGRLFFREWGIEIEKLGTPVCKACLDWTERDFHLAGKLGTALCHTLKENGWIESRETDRSITLTVKGRVALPFLK